MFSEVGILGHLPTVLQKRKGKEKGRKGRNRKKKKENVEEKIKKEKRQEGGRKTEVVKSRSQKMPNLWLLLQP